jgi:hypothetical protein
VRGTATDTKPNGSNRELATGPEKAVAALVLFADAVVINIALTNMRMGSKQSEQLLLMCADRAHAETTDIEWLISAGYLELDPWTAWKAVKEDNS